MTIYSGKFLIYQPNQSKLPPLKAIKNFTFGFAISIADGLWLRYLQASDYCDQVIDRTASGSSICKPQSWLYQNLNLATDLDPVFDPMMYRMGALSLTVIINDFEGASLLFDKGVKNHPKDWTLLYSAAYQAYFEEKNLKKAADLYARAAENGAPDWVGVMAGRLAAEGGDFEYAKKVLQTMIDTHQDEKLINRLQEKIDSLEKSNN